MKNLNIKQLYNLAKDLKTFSDFKAFLAQYYFKIPVTAEENETDNLELKDKRDVST